MVEPQVQSPESCRKCEKDPRYDPAALLVGIYPGEMQACVDTKAGEPVFIAAVS